MEGALLKTCRICGRAQPSDRFAQDKKCRDGLSTRCKDCIKVYASERYERLRREAGKERRRSYRHSQWQLIEARGSLRCRTCQLDKPLSDFRYSSRAPQRRRQCRDCERAQSAITRRVRAAERRAYAQKYRCKQYGITPGEYDRLIAAQGGNCPVCSSPLGTKRQTIDHDHRTGKVRGIVHWNCNLVLGNAQESIHVLRGAIAYLVRHGCRASE